MVVMLLLGRRQRRGDLVVLLLVLVVVCAELGHAGRRIGAHRRHLVVLAVDFALYGLLALLLVFGLLGVGATALDAPVAVLVDASKLGHGIRVLFGERAIIEVTVLDEAAVKADLFDVVLVDVVLESEVTTISIRVKNVVGASRHVSPSCCRLW